MTPSLTLLTTPLLIGWLSLPLALFAIALFSNWSRNGGKLAYAWRFTERLLLAILAVSLMIGVLLWVDRRLVELGLPESGARFGLYPDGLAVWMSLMVAFIGWVILRYASDYLRGDPARNTFLPWFLTTLACVLLLIMTDHLLVLAGAWIGVSLALHQLLTLYPQRSEARLAAAQKFIASRLGDVCVIAGVLLLGHHYGSFRLPDLQPASQGALELPVDLAWASVLLALAALLKCAQIPFHGWLIRVMEAPTPVSALLHAGVINLGGFLWLRLHPAFPVFTPGHGLLLVVAGITLVVAVITMMTQTSVKHALAWSTVSQMGFMLFEIALGAYTLAFLHLLAHSLYKAHSFLACGRTVKVSACYAPETTPGVATVLLALASGVVGSGLLWLWPGLVEGRPVLGGVLVLAVIASVLAIPHGANRRTRGWVALMALALVPVYGALHAVLGLVFQPGAEISLPTWASVVAWSLLGVLLGLSALVVFAGTRAWLVPWQARFATGLNLDQPFERLTRRLASKALAGPAGRQHERDAYPFSAGEQS